MKYLLQKYSDEYYVILNEDSDYQAGYVRPQKLGSHGPRYSVENGGGEKVAVVKSIDEAIPALSAYYEENPSQWERESDGLAYLSNVDAPGRRGPRYIKETQYGPLWVDQIKPGQWLTYRNDHELLIDGKIAIFTTCEEAQRAANAHLRDGYPNSETIDDGFSWLPDPEIDWWSCPYRTAARARLAVA